MSKEKALHAPWPDIKPAEINRILKPHGVRLVVKKSKEWGKNVTVTVQAIVVRKRSQQPAVPPVAGTGAAGG